MLIQALPRVIESKSDHEKAFALAVSLIDKADNRSAEETALLRLLSVLIESYESKKFMPAADDASGVDALKHLMESNGHTAKDLWAFADKAVISKILAGDRAISKNFAKALAAFYSVPASVFI